MRAVGHLDGNHYYAQIEAIYRPELRNKAFVVGGDMESRKGIVLTKSPLAKRAGVKTGNSIREALNVMPGLIVIPANYPLYLHFTKRMREIALQYTETIRPFGLDEFWFSLYGNRIEARKTVDEIRRQIWRQLCLTVSIGIGESLPYAKLGSDIAPNNGVFEAWNDEREKTVFPLPVSDLLYVGQATAERFRLYGIKTIGDLARSDPKRICRIMNNKMGESLWIMANGEDKTPVYADESYSDIKSIGNSNTFPCDLLDDDDVRAAFLMLAESVGRRMKTAGFEARTLNISLRDNGLTSITRQMKMRRPTNLIAEMVPQAMELFKRNYDIRRKPIRSLGIRGSDLIAENGEFQLDMWEDPEKREKLMRLERTTDMVRDRYGHSALRRGTLMRERIAKGVNSLNDEEFPIFYSY